MSSKNGKAGKNGVAPPLTKVTLARPEMERFVESLEKVKSVTQACRRIRISRQTAYRWRSLDPDFAAAWDEAWNAIVDDLEASAMDRAIHGYAETVVDKDGNEVGERRRYETALTIFMLRRNRPDKYEDRPAASVHIDARGGDVKVTQPPDGEDLREWLRRLNALDKGLLGDGTG